MRGRYCLIGLFACIVLGCADFTLFEEFAEPTQEPTLLTYLLLAIKPASPIIMADGTVTFSAVGGTPPYRYSLLAGGAGGTLDPATGAYTAPSVGGSDVVRVYDALDDASDASVTIIAASRLAIHPSAVTVNVGGDFQFWATGGTPPYAFIVRTGGGSINSSTGEYTAPGSTGAAYVRATDADGSTADSEIRIVAGGALAIVPTTPLVEENAYITFSATGGTWPYAFTVSSGAGAIGSAGGVYAADGAIGANVATITVTDSVYATASTTLSVVPAAPTNLIADGAFPGPQSIRLTWQDNSAGEEGYVVERKVGTSGAYAILATLGDNITTFDELTLTPNTVYGYRVYAYKGALKSPYSNESLDIPN